MLTIQDFANHKKAQQKLSMITCYDFWSAQIINQSTIDCVLVGDSGSMVMHGHSTTLPATVDMMVTHVQAVAKGAPKKFIVADMPFLSFRKSLDTVMTNVEKLMAAGAHAIKLEGAVGNLEIVKHIVESGVPVMGHLGLTPQSVNMLGGFKVQGKDEDHAKGIFEAAKQLEQAGCFSVVLECVPSELAQKITAALSIPTIGIGAGVDTDGQVLVLQDMLGMNPHFKPKFLKTYLNGYYLILNSLNQFHQEVEGKAFPTEKESYL